MEDELARLRAEIEELKRLRMQAILAELETRARLREAASQPTRMTIASMGDAGCGLLGPAPPSTRRR